MTLAKMMKRAQELQNGMQAAHDKLARVDIEGSAGGGMVIAVMNGSKELRRLKIDPSLLDPADAALVEDLVVAAVNDARAKVEIRVGEELTKLKDSLGSLDLPTVLGLSS